MSLKNYFFFIKKRMSSTKMSLFSIIAGTAGIALFLISVIIPAVLNNGHRSIERCLNDDIENYAVAAVDATGLFEKRLELLEAIDASVVIKSFGSWNAGAFFMESAVYDNIEYTSEIKKVFDSELREFDIDPSMTQSIFMGASVFEFNNLQLYKGTYRADKNLNQPVIYLGYNFRKIPVGTEIKKSDGSIYKVAGILKKGTEIIDFPVIGDNGGGLNLNYTIHMDNMFLVVSPDLKGYGFNSTANCLSFNEGYTYEDAKTELERIAAENGAAISIGRFSERVDEIMYSADWIVEKINAAMVIFIILSFVSVLTIQLLVTMKRKDELGILIANGVGGKEILKLLFIENAVKMAVSLLLGIGAYALFLGINGIQSSTLYHLKQQLFVYPFVAAVLYCILLTFVISLITYRYIRSMSVQQLINGNLE